jgi:thioredoxin reductase
VEEDFFDRANVEIMNKKVKGIDVEESLLYLKGQKDPIEFDKLIFAWGSEKIRLSKEYSNVHYIEDKYSHAKMHNDLLKSKKILIMGDTFEALQLASSAREYLD